MFRPVDASEFIPSVAWLGLREAIIVCMEVGAGVWSEWFCGVGYPIQEKNEEDYHDWRF